VGLIEGVRFNTLMDPWRSNVGVPGPYDPFGVDAYARTIKWDATITVE